MFSDTPPLRFVVLYHDAIPHPHFDLMFEATPGGDLATWRSPHWPPAPGDCLTRLPSHRAAYLEFEGDLSDERGRVRRITHGTFRRDETAALWVITFLEPDLLPIELPK